MTYINDDIQSIDLDKALERVSVQRRAYTQRYKKEHDQRLSVAAYLLLCKGLKEEFHIDEAPEFNFGSHGKPFLKVHPEVHFNLSHCDKAAVCEVSTEPVGIDAEVLTKPDADIMEMTMSENEIHAIMSSENPSFAFTRLWTMKESLLKLTGEGLCDNLPNVLSDSYRYKFHTTEHDGYVVTVCKFNQKP